MVEMPAVFDMVESCVVSIILPANNGTVAISKAGFLTMTAFSQTKRRQNKKDVKKLDINKNI